MGGGKMFDLKLNGKLYSGTQVFFFTSETVKILDKNIKNNISTTTVHTTVHLLKDELGIRHPYQHSH